MSSFLSKVRRFILDFTACFTGKRELEREVARQNVRIYELAFELYELQGSTLIETSTCGHDIEGS